MHALRDIREITEEFFISHIFPLLWLRRRCPATARFTEVYCIIPAPAAASGKVWCGGALLQRQRLSPSSVRMGGGGFLAGAWSSSRRPFVSGPVPMPSDRCICLNSSQPRHMIVCVCVRTFLGTLCTILHDTMMFNSRFNAYGLMQLHTHRGDWPRAPSLFLCHSLGPSIHVSPALRLALFRSAPPFSSRQSRWPAFMLSRVLPVGYRHVSSLPCVALAGSSGTGYHRAGRHCSPTSSRCQYRLPGLCARSLPERVELRLAECPSCRCSPLHCARNLVADSTRLKISRCRSVPVIPSLLRA